MMRHARLEHRFVEHIPECLVPGVLYVSMEYGTAVHSCCCGCGREVVTPLTPTDWHVTFDGEAVSLWPSIGNWNFPCRSHYFIKCGRAIEALSWSDEQVAAETQRDRSAKARFYGAVETIEAAKPTSPPTTSGDQIHGLWSRIRRWLSMLQ